MQQDYLKRVLMILFPVSLIGFLLIAISLTFGTSEAGKAMGFLEGVLVLIAGVWVVYARPINSFFKKYVITPLKKYVIDKMPHRKKKARKVDESNK